MDSRLGQVIGGKYKLIRLLGEGGMGSVYEGQHEVLGTRVAIKLLHPELARRTGLVERFLQEARVVAQIRSPHLVQVIDVDRTAEGQAYIVMELLDGEPLSAVLDRQHRLPVNTSCEYTVQILEALEAAHALGVVHRDLKPENVFVTFLGGKPVLKLIDFGIAKIRSDDPAHRNLTIAGAIMGTAEYMAPEQARSAAEADARSDVYAVGVMLYEMMAGTRPVLGDDARIIALKVERGEVTPLVQAMPEAPRELAGLVHRAMAARPELRFSSSTEMRLALTAAMSGKRPGPPTGQLAAVAPAATIANMAAVPAAASAADIEQSGGTGTLKGAQVEAVVAAAAARQQQQQQQQQNGGGAYEPSPATVRAPPVAPVIVPPAPAYEPRRSGGGGGGLGGKIRILAIPVVVGGSILVAVAMSSGSRSDPAPLITGGGGDPTSTSTGASTGTGGTVSTSDTTVRPLDTGGKGKPAPRPPNGGGGTVPTVIPSSVPSNLPGAIDAGAANNVPPPNVPPPTIGFNDAGVLVIPTALPTTLPTVLPFPFSLPTVQPTPTAAPTPSPAPEPTPTHHHHGDPSGF